MHETHLPAEQEETAKNIRISQENEDQERSQGDQPSPQSGTQTPQRLRFPKSARLLVSKEYRMVFKEGQKHLGQQVLFDYRLHQSSTPKLGITVSRRYGKAHLRNRFKRLIREVFRHKNAALPTSIEVNVLPRHSKQKVTK